MNDFAEIIEIRDQSLSSSAAMQYLRDVAKIDIDRRFSELVMAATPVAASVG